MKKFFRIVAVIALLGGVTLGCTKDYTKEIEDLQKGQETTNETLESIQTTIALLSNTVATTNADFSARIKQLETLSNQYKTDIAALQGDVEAQEKALAQLQADFDAAIADILKDIAALEAKDAELAAQIAGNAENISANAKAIAELKAWCLGLQGQVDALAARIQSIVAAPAENTYDMCYYYFGSLADTVVLSMAFDIYPEASAKAVTTENAKVLVEYGFTRAAGMDTTEAFAIQDVTVKGSRVYVTALIDEDKFNSGYAYDEWSWGYVKPYVSLQVTGKDDAGEICTVSAPVAANTAYNNIAATLVWTINGEPVEEAGLDFAGFGEDPAQLILGNGIYNFPSYRAPLQSLSWKDLENGGSVKGNDLFAGAELSVKPLGFDAYMTLPEAEKFFGLAEGTLAPKQATRDEALELIDMIGSFFGATHITEYYEMAKELNAETATNIQAPVVTMSAQAPFAKIDRTPMWAEGEHNRNAFIIDPEDDYWDYVYSWENPAAGLFNFTGADYDFSWTASLPADLDKMQYRNIVGMAGLNTVVYTIGGKPIAAAFNVVRVNGDEEAVQTPIQDELYVPFNCYSHPEVRAHFSPVTFYGTAGELALLENEPWDIWSVKEDGTKDKKVIEMAAFGVQQISTAKHACDIIFWGEQYLEKEASYIARCESATESNVWENVVTAKATEIEFTVAPWHEDVNVDYIIADKQNISVTSEEQVFVMTDFRDNIFADPATWVGNAVTNGGDDLTKADTIGFLDAFYARLVEAGFENDSVYVDGEKSLLASATLEIDEDEDEATITFADPEYGTSYKAFFSAEVDGIKFFSTLEWTSIDMPFSIENSKYVEEDGTLRVDGQSSMGGLFPGVTYYYQLNDIKFENLYVIKGLDKLQANEPGATVDVEAVYTEAEEGDYGQGYIIKGEVSAREVMTDYSIFAAAEENEGLIKGEFNWGNKKSTDEYAGQEVTLKATLHATTGYEFDDTEVELWTIAPLKAFFKGETFETMTPGKNLTIHADDSLVIYGAYVGDNPYIDYNEDNMWEKGTFAAGLKVAGQDFYAKYKLGSFASTPNYGQQKPVFDWTNAEWTLNGEPWTPTKGTHYTYSGYDLTILSDNIVGTLTVECPVTIGSRIAGWNGEVYEIPAETTFQATIVR